MEFWPISVKNQFQISSIYRMDASNLILVNILVIMVRSSLNSDMGTKTEMR